VPHPDFVIAGAGIIGLSLALELHERGASVTVLDAGLAMQQTSAAAAGMLAVDDPANPAALGPLASLSASLYPGFLDRIAALSGHVIPFQTETTVEARTRTPDDDATLTSDSLEILVPGHALNALHTTLLQERSVDPRQLGSALVAAVRNTSITLREHTSLTRLAMTADSVNIQAAGETISTARFIDCMGTWSPTPVAPRKGQMLAVKLPPACLLATVIRTPKVYIVPRTAGPNAGIAIIGATMEDTGFDLTVHPLDILKLNAHACALLPQLAHATFVESWSGLRPMSADGLPILGSLSSQPRYIAATGHFRNGILLAPATGHVIAQLLFAETPAVDLAPFHPTRFTPRTQ